MKHPKILVADDDKELTKFYCDILSSRGYKPCSANDGEETLSVIEKEKPDLVLSGVMLPKLHGLFVLEIVKATPETKHTKVIMLTAIADEHIKKRALKLGAADYLVKDETTIAELLDKIKKVA